MSVRFLARSSCVSGQIMLREGTTKAHAVAQLTGANAQKGREIEHLASFESRGTVVALDNAAVEFSPLMMQA